MNLISFFLQNWDSILLIVAAVILTVIFAIKGEMGILFSIAFRLVTEAEKQYGSGTGLLKKAAVIEWLYDKVPAVLRLFFAKEQLEQIIEEALATAKQKWETNPSIKQYIENPQIIQAATIITQEQGE